MKVILLEELPGRGGEGDVIDVARGYANNYLLTHGIAIPATKGNLKQLEQRRKNIAKREEVRIANAESLKAQLEGATFTIKAKVGDEGILFGSVTPQMIVEAIKVVGEHAVEISIYRDIKAEVKLLVTDEQGVVFGAEAPAEPEAVEEVADEAAEEAVEEAAEEAVEEAVEAAEPEAAKE